MSENISINYGESSKDKPEIIVIDDSSSETEIDVAPREVEKGKKVSTNKVEKNLQSSSTPSFAYNSKNIVNNNFNSISIQSNSRSRVTKENFEGRPHGVGISASKQVSSRIIQSSVPYRAHYVNAQTKNFPRTGYEPQVSFTAEPSKVSLKSGKIKKRINIRYIPYESVPPPVKPDVKLLHNHLDKPLQKFTTGIIAAQNFPKATNGDLHKICGKYSLKPNPVVNRDIAKLYQDTSIEKIIADMEDRVMEDMTLRCAKGGEKRN